MVMITVDLDKCTGCGACVDSCQHRILEMQDGVCVPMKPEMCRFCMLCVAACKPKAISVEV
ncbi:MAG TPA: 4Fe-4S dicluster domain-containing protein [Methanosarcinaceae archaeon]|nr:4Fe-4S dicluster domain-containing protein [Methanosarcinaceae archaeon]